MTDELNNAYEGMFLFPQSQSGALQAAIDLIRDILERAGAEIISFQKWDERRLAYEIKGNKRGVYFLVYFRAPTTAPAAIERSCNLSEQLLRSMILRADYLTHEQMAAADRSAELADEIKVRDEQAKERGEDAPAGRRGDAGEGEKGKKEPATVETEAGAKDAAATVER